MKERDIEATSSLLFLLTFYLANIQIKYDSSFTHNYLKLFKVDKYIYEMITIHVNKSSVKKLYMWIYSKMSEIFLQLDYVVKTILIYNKE